jgi:hypothetical protein
MALDYDDFIDRIYLSEMVICILIIIFAILGNTLVLVATWRERSLHQPNKYFVACLAVADLLVGMILTPLRLYQLVNIENGGITTIHLCRFYIWMDVFLETSSIYTLTFISFDRYLKISQPLQYRSRMTTSTLLKIIFIIWLIAATYATLAMFPYADSPGIFISTLGCFNINKIFYTFVAVSGFFLPTTVMLVMYILIFLVAHKRQKMLRNGELGQTSNNPNQRSALLQDLKVIRMLFVVVGVFIFCWGPFIIWLMIYYYYNPSVLFDSSSLSDLYLKTILWRLATFLPLLNSIFNPLIYACLDQKYKEAFRHIFQRMMCRPSSRREPPQ